MKCEICHNADAQVAIEKDDEELYVCKSCADKERVSRQKRSQRTRKISRDGVEMTVTEISSDGDAPPQIVKAIMNAFDGMLSGIEKASQDAKKSEKPQLHDFPVERAEAAYRVGSGLHLEGLYLIGELDAVRRSAHALNMDLVGISADGVKDSGHVFRLGYSGSQEQAKRFVEDLLAQERNARIRLREEMPRVFGDSLCRALAILKNCRLLSPGELFDLLSPLRLAAIEKMLDGITLRTIESMMMKIDLSSKEDELDINERDRIDAERADEMNARFEDVVLNEKAEGKFL